MSVKLACGRSGDVGIERHGRTRPAVAHSKLNVKTLTEEEFLKLIGREKEL